MSHALNEKATVAYLELNLKPSYEKDKTKIHFHACNPNF